MFLFTRFTWPKLWRTLHTAAQPDEKFIKSLVNDRGSRSLRLHSPALPLQYTLCIDIYITKKRKLQIKIRNAFGFFPVVVLNIHKSSFRRKSIWTIRLVEENFFPLGFHMEKIWFGQTRVFQRLFTNCWRAMA